MLDRSAQKEQPYAVDLGIGTDTNRLAPQAPVNTTDDSNPVIYPFASHDSRVTFDKQTSDNRKFDLNTEGLAHYGLLPDLVEDKRINSDDETMKTFFNSAKAYLQMWERAEKTKSY